MADDEFKRAISDLNEKIGGLSQVIESLEREKTVISKKEGEGQDDPNRLAEVLKTTFSDSQEKFIASFKTEVEKLSLDKVSKKMSETIGNLPKALTTALGQVIGRLIDDAIKNFEQVRKGTAQDVQSIAVKHAQAGNPLSTETIENLASRFEYSRQIEVRERRRIEEVVGTGSFLGEKTGLSPVYRAIRNEVQDWAYNVGEPEERRFRADEDPNYLKMLQREKDRKEKQVNDNHVYHGTEG